ncbi:HTH-type transcriptional repressor YvoA [Moorella thermoacetica]|uniref:HTH-type transcriptional repressor YvoA n=3 Tax=Neomoorella thermoacetica TaxID=1525 RepID=A0AAC9HI16_NEOTH|nr:GntR family transcriptional regulator [Moorella thermoacetica]AKX94089.1 HTH-type transcriptional repressor YvoA [Moorella thermoacetica]AKX96728.1 HTH-type transcriptional repressor YvoA [Moorella thermoacetica]AOQ24041.1 HTH-type transcriptional repressor YvoA [Moorella thermoacetica]OIQ57898.1 HTH-type transcriptional repressor YvoA [Moorella thermoacetica]QDA00540.1 HTH-type transcriptional repressor YvoA [Moorella thermoacetica]
MKNEKMVIDKNSFIPPYYQLAQILEQQIRSGQYRPGDTLPSEAELSEKYGLSRMTVRRSLSQLARAGLIYSEQGKGTFVSRPRLDRAVFVMEEFHTEMAARGLVSSVRLMEARVVPAPQKAATKLQVPVGEKVLYIRRSLLADGEPMAYDRKYLRYDRGRPILENELQYQALPEMVEKHGEVLPVSSQMTLQATVLNEEEARALRVAPGTPAFLLEQILFDNTERPVGWGWCLYRGDRYQLSSQSPIF